MNIEFKDWFFYKGFTIYIYPEHTEIHKGIFVINSKVSSDLNYKQLMNLIDLLYI